MPQDYYCARCGKPVVSETPQAEYLCAECEQGLGEAIEKVWHEIAEDRRNQPVQINYGQCPTCGAEMAPLDGGGGTYCPEGCQF